MIYSNDRDPNDEMWEQEVTTSSTHTTTTERNIVDDENDDEEEVYNTFAVDIPSAITDHKGRYEEWINIDTFKTWEEALEFARENFGADDEGKVCLISKF